MIDTLYHLKSRQATWLELFFDLVFVAVIGAIAHDLAHTHDGHLSFAQVARFPMMFIPVWWIWTTHTLYANRFDNNDRSHRFFALVIMGLLIPLSTLAADSFRREFYEFTVLYAGIRVLLAILYLRVDLKQEGQVTFAREMAGIILTGALISGSSLFFEGRTKFLIFYLGIAVDMTLQFLLRHKTKQFPVDRKHLVERTGLLAIIILGESVISMVASLSSIQVWSSYAIASAVTGFTLIWTIWWIYFDSFSILERAKRITDGNILIYSHLVLCMGLLVLANLIGYSIKRDLDQETFRILAITGMFCFYIGKQTIYMACFPPLRTRIFVKTFLCLSITIASTYLPRIEYSMMGITIGMFLYVYITMQWKPRNSMEPYLIDEEH